MIDKSALERLADAFPPGGTVTEQQLFDTGQYLNVDGRPHKIRYQEPRPGVEIPLEPLAPGWHVIRNHHGVTPFFHQIKANLTYGSVSTLCGLKGSTITNAGVRWMVRCPICDLAEQMS
jgi:hypothetical protein